MIKDRFARKAATALERLLPAVRRSALGVAVSGGPDSVALLAALVSVAPELELQLHVLHMNHGLRPEAGDEQQLVETLCSRWQIPCTVERLIPPTKRNGIEVWAREARYRFFRRVRDDSQLAAVALAHTLDDQAETVLFRCLRGSVRRGLAGIPPIREGWIVRPLLSCTRHEVMQYITAHKLPFVTDASNMDLHYTRNRIRHSLLPLLEREFSPRIREHLASMAEVFREEETWLEELAATALGRVRELSLVLSVSRLALEPTALQPRILRQWLEGSASTHEVTSTHLSCLRRLTSGSARGVVNLPGGVSVRREGQSLVFEEKAQDSSYTSVAPLYQHVLMLGQEVDIAEGGWRVKISMPFVWEGPPQRARSSDLWQALFDAEACGGQLLVRNFRPGDRIAPLGLGGQKKVHDVFIDAKVPPLRRRVLPLIAIGDLVAWIPGCVRGETAKIAEQTQRVCRAEVIPLPEK